MKQITLEVLHDAANRLMFDMSEEEYQTLLKEFDFLKEQMSMIAGIEGLDEAEPMTFPYDATTDYLRDDEAGEVLETSDVLANAGSVLDGQIKLPKVVG